MARPATADQLREILEEHSLQLQRQLGLTRVQFSLPADGKGLRIKVSVPAGEEAPIPSRMEFSLHGHQVEVPLERSEDYQPYEPL
ncbi:MAG TPA: hypothetical protein EYP56_20765 [Planctomycetaceae bacterium]|nr:hypothetical protein [Planctomycetaceae bacterium]